MTDPVGSILSDVKKVVGIGSDDTVFDIDIIMHINSAFADLYQIADLGGTGGYAIEDVSNLWTEVIDDKKYLNSVKSYVTKKVRIAFDPLPTSFGTDAVNSQIKEAEWRLSLYAPPADYSSEGA